MNLNLRKPANRVLRLGVLLILPYRWLPRPFSDPSLCAGLILVSAGLLLRLLSSDSRARHGRGRWADVFTSGVLAVPAAAAWWHWPVPEGERPRYGGLFEAEFMQVFAWSIALLLILVFQAGMSCEAPEE